MNNHIIIHVTTSNRDGQGFLLLLTGSKKKKKNKRKS